MINSSAVDVKLSNVSQKPEKHQPSFFTITWPPAKNIGTASRGAVVQAEDDKLVQF